MRNTYLRRLVAFVSVALAGGVLGVAVGLWEHTETVLDDLRDTVGRTTWVVEREDVVGLQPPPLPDEARLAPLLGLEGVRGHALATGTTRVVGEFGYPLIGVSADYFRLRRFPLAEGRVFTGETEAVVGANLADRLGEDMGEDAAGRPYRVVGVLAPVAARGGMDTTADDSLFVPLGAYAGPEIGASTLYLETTPERFEEVGGALRQWLISEGIDGYRVLPLADQYGAELRETVAGLLSGALGFGVAATLLVAVVNLVAFYLSRASGHLKELGVRRAVGASRAQVIREEVSGAVSWLGGGLLASLPLIHLGSRYLEKSVGVGAQPGLLTLLATGLGLALPVFGAAYFTASWTVGPAPARTLRGEGITLQQRRLWLAGVGLALGVAGLVVQGATARSAQLETERVLGQLDERTGVYASLLTGSFGDPRATVSLTGRDYAALLESAAADAFDRTAFVRTFRDARVQAAGREVETRLRVFEGDLPALGGGTLLAGRWPDPAAETALERSLAEALFGTTPAVDKEVTTFGRSWRVVGVFQTGSRGLPGAGGAGDALLPGASLRPPGFGAVLVRVAPGRDVTAALQAGADVLNARYDAVRYLPFKPWRPADFAPPVRETLDRLSSVYLALTVVLLVLGGLGLVAQMLVSVSLRVREIGIRRATGATRRAVFAQFLGEALGLGLAASAAGLVLGVLLALLAARVQNTIFSLDSGTTALALGLGLVTAGLSAAGPSLLAARLPPARAIQERAG